jgi:hypothetical protein
VVADNDSPLSTLGNVIGPSAIPILLDVLYEVCYLVHKRRSVNFFGLEFDQGHRVKILSSTTRSFVLRNFIRVLSSLSVYWPILKLSFLLHRRQRWRIAIIRISHEVDGWACSPGRDRYGYYSNSSPHSAYSFLPSS